MVDKEQFKKNGKSIVTHIRASISIDHYHHINTCIDGSSALGRRPPTRLLPRTQTGTPSLPPSLPPSPSISHSRSLFIFLLYLYSLSPPSNGGDTEDNLSLDEKLRRERQRGYPSASPLSHPSLPPSLPLSLPPLQVLSPPSNGGDTEDNLSLDEKLRRERQRAYAVGITTYAWGKGGKILVPLQVRASYLPPSLRFNLFRFTFSIPPPLPPSLPPSLPLSGLALRPERSRRPFAPSLRC